MTEKDLNQYFPEKTESAKISPYSVIGGEAENRPHFIDTSQTGTRWSGMIRGDDIVELGGETYGDTDINLTNSDNRARIDRAKSVPQEEDLDELYSDPDQMQNFFDRFARRIHKDDVVGDYFPAVLAIQAAQARMMSLAADKVLTDAYSEQIRELEVSRTQQNDIAWRQKDEKGNVSDEAVVQVEENNEEIDLAILSIKQEAATEVLGVDKAAEIEAKARRGLANGEISEIDLERRVTAELMHEAAREKLPEVEAELEEGIEVNGKKFNTYAELEAEEDRLWTEKHQNQNDFSDAISDGNPDCSEYASLTAVSLAESGIPNLRVMGHSMTESVYPIVGAHAYNVILDQSGENIVGVFEGTATSGTFRQVMNDVSLADFEAGATLVTLNNQGEWSTYGTGAPAEGRGLYDFVGGEFVSEKIERHDLALIHDTKMEHLRSLDVGMVADRLIDVYQQYGDSVKIPGWADLIRDDGSPTFAKVMDVMNRYDGDPADLRGDIINVIERAKSRALEEGDVSIAITEANVYELDSMGATPIAEDLKNIMDRLRNIDPSQLAGLKQQNPWLEEAMDLMEGRPGYVEALLGDLGNSDLEAYRQLGSIVQNEDISVSDLNELYSSIERQPQRTIGLQLNS